MTEEKILFEGHPAMFRNDPIGFLLSVVLCVVGVGLVILLVWWLSCRTTTLTVTNERTTLRRGIMSKSLNEVWHRDVRNVQLYKSFFQRIFGVGSIGISSAGQSGIEVSVRGIRNPEGVKDIIDRYRRANLGE